MQFCMKPLDWNHLRAFHATATTGSLSAAAIQLGLTQPTLSRQVQALEARLDIILFERQGRRLVLTQTGRELCDRIAAMQVAAENVAVAASGQQMALTGRVRISATDSIATFVLPGLLGFIRAQAPHLTIEILAANEVSDLHQMEADIAIRHAAPNRSGLVGHHVHDTEAWFYASPDWINQNGTPTSLADLAGAALIGFDDTERLASHYRMTGIAVEASDFKMVSNSSVVVWEMVKRGLGVAPMLTEVARQTPEMVKLLPDTTPVPVPIWLVTHKELQPSPGIQLVHRVLAQELARLVP